MLAECRGGPAQFPWRTAHLEQRAGILQRAGDRMTNLDEEAAGLEMFGVEQVAHGRYRSERNSPGLRLMVQLFHGLILEPFLNEKAARVPVGGALAAALE